ncbi:MAG: polyhydroxyalkanoate synthesis regulator DNA-binding domain-containing protein [Syntrophales bacterium]
MADKVLLKKYTNRRLYDTERNAYVTLNQVAGLIKEGRHVEVIDARSKEDVTAFILTQIVLEEAKKKNVLLPVPLLHLIIRYGETILNEFFDKYLQQILRNYLAYKASVDVQFSKWLDLGINLAEATQKTMSGEIPPFTSIFDFFQEQAKDGKKKS